MYFFPFSYQTVFVCTPKTSLGTPLATTRLLHFEQFTLFDRKQTVLQWLQPKCNFPLVVRFVGMQNGLEVFGQMLLINGRPWPTEVPRKAGSTPKLKPLAFLSLIY